MLGLSFPGNQVPKRLDEFSVLMELLAIIVSSVWNAARQ